MKRYTILLTPDLDEGGYTVTVPVLRGCITEGDALEDAVDNARDAIRLYLSDLEASGEPIPEERAAPELTAVKV